MPSLLVVDDDRSVTHFVGALFRDSAVEVNTAATAADAVAMVRELEPDAVLVDIVLPDGSGLDVVRQIREIDERIPIIVITSTAESEMAIEAMMAGAFDFIVKPLDAAKVKQLVAQAIEIRALMATPVEVPKPRVDQGGEHRLIGRSPEMLEVYKAVGRVAPQDVTVLIRGESGTGKELIARAIYQHSPRANKPFLAVNCAAIPEALLESELFGHEKGAFTGADQRRIGKFEQCNGGTIFLDEIGEMPALLQAKLLRLIQEQKFERVGGNQTIQTDVRIITATNRDLETMTADASFRLDLFYRLNVFTISLPPLRERGEDLLLLIDSLLFRYAEELNKSLRRISPEAIKLLLDYQWPGNIRELQNVLRKSLLNATGAVLIPDFLPEEIRGGAKAHSTNGDDEDSLPHDLRPLLKQRIAASSENLYAEMLEFMERYLLTRVMQHCSGNQSAAARLLGITRGSLRNKLQQQQITVEQVIQTDES